MRNKKFSTTAYKIDGCFHFLLGISRILDYTFAPVTSETVTRQILLGHWDNKINCVFYHNPKGTGNRLTFVAGALSFCAYLSYQGKITYASAEDNLSYCDKIRKHPKKDDGTFQSKRRDVFEKRLGETKTRLHKIEVCVERV